MIVISVITLILAIFLEGITTSIMVWVSPNFLLITLLMIYPFFIEKKKAYLILLFVSTIFYDILYTNILFLNTVCLFCIYLFMEKNLKRPDTDVFYLIGCYFLYHILIFSCFYIVGYTTSPILFLEVLVISSIPNILYTCILYSFIKLFYLTKRQSKKFQYTS